jgi:hypothetical protein
MREEAVRESQLEMSACSSADDEEDEGACEGEENVHETRKVL